jgi:LPS O-antigen subunit length determinant protein (WzzB/FepE family)
MSHNEASARTNDGPDDETNAASQDVAEPGTCEANDGFQNTLSAKLDDDDRDDTNAGLQDVTKSTISDIVAQSQRKLMGDLQHTDRPVDDTFRDLVRAEVESKLRGERSIKLATWAEEKRHLKEEIQETIESSIHQAKTDIASELEISHAESASSAIDTEARSDLTYLKGQVASLKLQIDALQMLLTAERGQSS